MTVHRRRRLRVMVLGVGSAAQGVLQILKENNAEVRAYLTQGTGHYGPCTEAEAYDSRDHPNPCELIRNQKIDLVIPMSIDWLQADWAGEFIAMGVPILSPTGEGMKLERDRYFGKNLCDEYGIPYPRAFVAKNRQEAEKIIDENPIPLVIKNRLCSPSSPIHTILCETPEDTRSWLRQINYEEGIFLQEYLGSHEAGHIALVSDGQIYSLVTNQEYKRAFDGNMGIVAGAPLGGIVEQDPEDKYNLAKELLQPLKPWFERVAFHGPVQVTAMHHNDKWHVLEYNVRIGVTCGPVILRMLSNPLKVLLDVASNRKTDPHFNDDVRFGCSLTLAGYGYPYSQVQGPRFPITALDTFDCCVWWNEVTLGPDGRLQSDGQRLADVVSMKPTLTEAVANAYQNITKIRCLSSYYRTDIGKSLWPP